MNRVDPGILGGRYLLDPSLLQVPVVDAADEGRDERDLGMGAGNRLRKAEEQRQVAVNSLLLQPLGGTDSFPGRGDLDQDPLPANSVGLIKVDQVMGLADRGLGIER